MMLISNLKVFLNLFISTALIAVVFTSSVFAVSDPRSFSNNKVGIGILSPEAEINEAAEMVNNNGDWGYVLIVIKKSEMNVDRWQSVFHLLSKKHLIPIVRIATEFDSEGYWQAPEEGDARLWADFLNKLYWPTKNRYVQVYNEVNRSSEWGGLVDPEGYANELNKTAHQLKAKSDDFFVLNSPLDLALGTSSSSLEAQTFLQEMNRSTPGVFEKLDGWASHSYPNPGFSSSPLNTGRTSVQGYRWELALISPYLNGKDLSVFITETGWRRSAFVTEDVISDYFETAFEKVWSDQRVVAVTPFVLNYQDTLFKDFSFKADPDVLGKSYYSYYSKIRDLPKIIGEPQREDRSSEIELRAPDFLIVGVDESVKITIRNTGNFIWKAENLKIDTDTIDLTMEDVSWAQDEILPGQVAVATAKVESLKEGETNFSIVVSKDKKVLSEAYFKLNSETQLAQIIRIIKAFI